MPRYQCYRRDCSRIRSEFSLFLNRRQLPKCEGNNFCSDSCLHAHFVGELSNKWRLLQMERNRSFPRPKLGTILMQTAFVTRDQLDHAVRLQSERKEGRIGEWLLRLGYVEEHQITAALAKQFGLPLINLKHATAKTDAVRMIPGKVAKCSGLIPVGFSDSNAALRVAVSGPVNFHSQEAIRRMVRKGIVAYIGDESAIKRLLEQWYESEDLDLSDVPTFGTLEELLEIGNEMIVTAINRRAADIQAELAQDFFWVRMDFTRESHHHIFRYLAPPAQRPEFEKQKAMAVGYSGRL